MAARERWLTDGALVDGADLRRGCFGREPVLVLAPAPVPNPGDPVKDGNEVVRAPNIAVCN
jgi:hypothetical protein